MMPNPETTPATQALAPAGICPKDGRSRPPVAIVPHMTDLHPLAPLLAPRSVAIFGASNDPTRISGRSLRYFREAGFRGALYPINPTRDTVQGLRAFPDLAAVPGEVDF